MSSLLHGFRHYATFTGRDTRATYWGFIVSTHLIFILLLLPCIYTFMSCVEEFLNQPGVVPLLLTAAEGNAAAMDELLDQSREFAAAQRPYPLLTLVATAAAVLWGFAIILPTISATMRRLRDAGQSPWWAIPPLLSFMPLLGGFCTLLSLVTLVLCLLPTAVVQTPSAPPVSQDENRQPPQS